MKKYVLCLIISFLIIRSSNAATHVSGIYSSSQTWTAANSPYILDSNTYFKAGATLIIQAGVTIQSSLNYILNISGGFEATGTSKSHIVVNGVRFVFNKSANQYNPSTGTGYKFINCELATTSKSSNLIALKKASIKIDSCIITNCDYPVNGFDSCSAWITNSSFYGDQFGFLVYGFGTKSYLYFAKNYSDFFGYISTPEICEITQNYFKSSLYYAAISFSVYTKKANISCNYFKKGNLAIDLNSSLKKGTNISITQNNFDSVVTCINSYCASSLDTFLCENNNFKNYSANNAIKFANCFTVSGTFKTLDFTKNYWNTTDTNIIKASFEDFNTNNKIPYKINYQSYLTSAQTACWPTTPGGAVTSGMIQIKNLQSVKIYPNPTDGILNFESTQIIRQIHIYQPDGKLVRQAIVNAGTYSMSLVGLSQGVYFVQTGLANGQFEMTKIMY